MPERDLKHYKEYLRKLKLYAEGVGLKLVFSTRTDSEGVYMPSRKKIVIEEDMSESAEIAVILHELGHSLDEIIYNDATAKPLDAAYKAVYKNKGTANQKEIVLACERRAWKLGRVLAKKLGIRLGKWYSEAARVCIKSYKAS